MIFQLPCGRVLYLSTEDYLALSDEEIKAIANNSFGEEISHKMFYGTPVTEVEEEETHDFDYTPESEEPDKSGSFNIHHLPEDIDFIE